MLVSSQARIDRPAGNSFSEVIKADQFLTSYQKNLDASLNTVTGFLSGVSKAFLGESPEVLARKLVQMHRPITFNFAARFGKTVNNVSHSESPHAKPALSAADTGIEWGPKKPAEANSLTKAITPRCKTCGGTALSIQYGKSYYWKCRACEANTAIKITCGIDTHKERIRKEGPTFYRECAQCQTSSVYFVNPAVK